MTSKAMAEWHKILKSKDQSGLDDLLADDVVFHSPVVHTPQEGKFITKMYLMAAAHVLGGDDFTYVREVHGPNDAVLEFVTEIDGILINGIDMIKWNDDDQITDFKVMLRPLKAVNKVHQMMGEMLNSMKK